MSDYGQIVARIRELEDEHFKEPCHPTRCSHLSPFRPRGPRPMSEVTRTEIEALTQDDMEFWLGNKFVDPADLIKKVEWWASAVVAARVAAAEREFAERAAQVIKDAADLLDDMGSDGMPAALYYAARIVRDLMPRKDGE
jgi:hypothetical protein